MMELCGYETIIQGDSGFCNVFTDDEWLDGEWYFDVSPFRGFEYCRSVQADDCRGRFVSTT